MGKPGVATGTRAGFPELWGVGEIQAFAGEVAARIGKGAPGVAAVWGWSRISDFPEPVASLEMGYVYLAREVRPWVEAFVERQPDSPRSTERVPEEVRKAIVSEKGKASIRKAAAKYGVGHSTVQRIWAQQ